MLSCASFSYLFKFSLSRYSICYSQLSHSTLQRLVMEENERKNIHPNHLGTTLLRHEKKITMCKCVKETYAEEKDTKLNCSMKEIETLPLRTDYIRAKFQEKIDEENKLTTTALVEPPPNRIKEDFIYRKRNFSGTAVDAPDDAGPPGEFGFPSCRNPIGSDCKDRPLIVRLPDLDKCVNNCEEVTSEECIPSKVTEPEFDKTVKDPADIGVDNKHEEEEVEADKDDDCIVNCIYYTQQFCDCTIL